ncbi:hypothetical protein KSP40_PGU010151 [Platanthera guangdongensis]|uniref:Uncharacterized protein n=1 Tax=Platanthera guangdongensis TaxID=2320717 RepID=A0ABR2MPA1_9ASPA
MLDEIETPLFEAPASQSRNRNPAGGSSMKGRKRKGMKERERVVKRGCWKCGAGDGGKPMSPLWILFLSHRGYHGGD